jgi:hypothetical protein
VHSQEKGKYFLFCEYLCFSMAVALNQCTLTPDIHQYFFACAAQVLIIFGMALDKGGEAHGHNIFVDRWLVQVVGR